MLTTMETVVRSHKGTVQHSEIQARTHYGEGINSQFQVPANAVLHQIQCYCKGFGSSEIADNLIRL